MTLTFGPFALDRSARQLLRAGQAIRLSPKAFELLMLLVARRPEAISKADIHKALWPDTFVSDVNLAVLIAEVRSALGDDARRPVYIRTVHRFGYAFAGTVVEGGSSAAVNTRVPVCWLSWGGERAALRAGQNLIGRDPSADIRVDAVGVSRRHALIVVSDDEITVQDLASKNGTYINNVRVTSPVRLVDGAELRVGPLPLQFRQPDATMSTQTLTTPSRRMERP